MSADEENREQETANRGREKKKDRKPENKERVMHIEQSSFLLSCAILQLPLRHDPHPFLFSFLADHLLTHTAL